MSWRFKLFYGGWSIWVLWGKNRLDLGEDRSNRCTTIRERDCLDEMAVFVLCIFEPDLQSRISNFVQVLGIQIGHHFKLWGAQRRSEGDSHEQAWIRARVGRNGFRLDIEKHIEGLVFKRPLLSVQSHTRLFYETQIAGFFRVVVYNWDDIRLLRDSKDIGWQGSADICVPELNFIVAAVVFESCKIKVQIAGVKLVIKHLGGWKARYCAWTGCVSDDNRQFCFCSQF